MPVTPLANFETGVMFWAGRNPQETLTELKALGVRCGQMGIPGDLDLSCAAEWRKALAAGRVYGLYGVCGVHG